MTFGGGSAQENRLFNSRDCSSPQHGGLWKLIAILSGRAQPTEEGTVHVPSVVIWLSGRRSQRVVPETVYLRRQRQAPFRVIGVVAIFQNQSRA